MMGCKGVAGERELRLNWIERHLLYIHEQEGRDLCHYHILTDVFVLAD